jgi:hypothetical protein
MTSSIHNNDSWTTLAVGTQLCQSPTWMLGKSLILSSLSREPSAGSQEEAKRVENLYKIRVDYFSVSELGYKTPFYIRPVPKPPFLARTSHNIDLIYQ